VNDEAAVAEECADVIYRRCEFVDVCDREGVRGDLAVLTRQIADLTGLWELLIAGWRLAADEGIQMAKSLSTVARVWDWSYMNMVDWLC